MRHFCRVSHTLFPLCALLWLCGILTWSFQALRIRPLNPVGIFRYLTSPKRCFFIYFLLSPELRVSKLWNLFCKEPFHVLLNNKVVLRPPFSLRWMSFEPMVLNQWSQNWGPLHTLIQHLVNYSCHWYKALFLVEKKKKNREKQRKKRQTTILYDIPCFRKQHVIWLRFTSTISIYLVSKFTCHLNWNNLFTSFQGINMEITQQIHSHN